MSKTKATFETRLNTFKRSIKTNMAAAMDCSNMAMEHFAKTGDVVYMQAFYDAMPQNYLRKAAFVEWCVVHAPVMLDGKKWKKDKTRSDEKCNLDGAMAAPFWEFKPEQEVVNFSAADFAAKVLSLVKRYENTEKTHAKDDAATALVVAVKGVVENQVAA